MRTIERTNAFRRDYKREKSGLHGRDIEELLFATISLLAEDKPLPEKNRDHSLGGQWRYYRECHLRPDLLLIYRKPNAEVQQLVRLGSHSELFG
jgi:mRNA interferase YafQ